MSHHSSSKKNSHHNGDHGNKAGRLEQIGGMMAESHKTKNGQMGRIIETAEMQSMGRY